MTTTPASLLERLRLPFDPEAWSRFVALYAPLIHSWGRRVGLQEQDAADLTQEVFTTLVQILPTFAYDRDKSFRCWLRTVTLNKWKNGRKQWFKRSPQQGGDELKELAAPDELEEIWEAEYRQSLVARALCVMRADFQESTWKACWEMVVEERKAADVAAELGLSAGAVYAAKVRVLDRLRRELQGMLD